MLIVDQIIDDPNEHGAGNMPRFLQLNEECIKELSFLFARNDIFWKCFAKAKSVYFKSVKFEKSEWTNLDVISKTTFEELAENKSASLCYPLVDALASLRGHGSETDEMVKKFLKHLHIAFQYQDDVDDFKKDKSNHQRTYAHYLVETRLKQEGGFPEELTADIQYKLLFTSGLAADLLREAIQNYKECEAIAQQLELTALNDFVVGERVHCEGQRSEIDLLIAKTKIKMRKNNAFRFSSGSESSISLDKVLAESVKYLQNNSEDGIWTDFMTTAGTSKYWVTYYTAYHLAECGIHLPILNELSARISARLINGAYNDTMQEDGDTLNFMVGFMRLYCPSKANELSKNWLAYQMSNGGWATYVDEESLRIRLHLAHEVSVKGWTTPKNCVSATACKMASLFSEYESEKTATEQFLLDRQSDAGYWNSYWWTSPIYATSWTIQAMADNEIRSNVCEKACRWLLQTQCQRGAWLNSFTNEESPFYTACALKGLLSFQPEQHLDAIEKAVNWLLRHQTLDGSWQVARILAIPSTDTEDSATVAHWRKSSFGVNSVVDDHNRVFTTVSVTNALQSYKNYTMRGHAKPDAKRINSKIGSEQHQYDSLIK
jgi:hypothetical protein